MKTNNHSGTNMQISRIQHWKSAALFLVVAATGAPCALADSPLETQIGSLTQQLESRRKEFHIPGMAVAVVKDGKVVLSKGFGLADVDQERPATPETVFAIGSSTKAFTATAIGMLVDDGKSRWDDPVSKHLPYFQLPVTGDKADVAVTLRDLLCHRTGFTRMGVLWASGNASSEEVLRAATKAKPWRPFRKECHYCNVTFMAAGEAGAVANETTWDQLITDRIFKPLGMTNSSTTNKAMRATRNRSLGYRWRKETSDFASVPLRNLDNIAPSGSINSNVIDMAKWVQFQLAKGRVNGKQLISAPQLEETWTKQISMGGGVDYGLGWMLQTINGKRVVEHGGSIDGFAAQVGLFPDQNSGFVLLMNVTATPLQQLSLRLFADAMLEEDFGEKATPGETEDQLKKFTGDYLANAGPFKDATFAVKLKNGKLAVDVPGQMLYELKAPNAQGKRSFAITDQVAVSFHEDAAGNVANMKMYQAGHEFTFPRMSAKAKSSPLGSDDANETNGRDKDAADLDLPTFAQIVQLRKMKQRKKLFDQFESIKIVRDANFEHSGVRGQITIYAQGKERLRVEMDLGKFGRSVQILNGDKGWVDSDLQYSTSLTGGELAQVRLEFPHVIMGDWRESFEEIQVVGKRKVGKRDAIIVRLKDKRLPPVSAIVDAKSGDIIGLETRFTSNLLAGQTIPVAIEQRDYRDFHGIRIPKLRASENPMMGRVVSTGKSFETNVTLDASLFEIPSE